MKPPMVIREKIKKECGSGMKEDRFLFPEKGHEGIPDTVIVGGMEYKVEFVDIVDPRDHNVDGNIFHDLQIIRIKNRMGPDYTGYVFMHELVHAIFENCYFEQNEVQVNQIAAYLYQILKDNDIDFRYRRKDSQ